MNVQRIEDEIDETHKLLRIIDECDIDWKDLCEMAKVESGREDLENYPRTRSGGYILYGASDPRKLEFIDTYDYNGEYLLCRVDTKYAGRMTHAAKKFSIGKRESAIKIVNKTLLTYGYLFLYLHKIARRYVDGDDKLTAKSIRQIPIPILFDKKNGSYSRAIEIQNHIVMLMSKNYNCVRLFADYMMKIKNG